MIIITNRKLTNKYWYVENEKKQNKTASTMFQVKAIQEEQISATLLSVIWKKEKILEIKKPQFLVTVFLKIRR